MGLFGNILSKKPGPEIEKIPDKKEEKLPNTMIGLEKALEDVYLRLQTIKEFSNLRNINAESLEAINYGNQLLKRLGMFLKYEKNEAALSSKMKEIKHILDNKGGLEDVIKVFEEREKEKIA